MYRLSLLNDLFQICNRGTLFIKISRLQFNDFFFYRDATFFNNFLKIMWIFTINLDINLHFTDPFENILRAKRERHIQSVYYLEMHLLRYISKGQDLSFFHVYLQNTSMNRKVSTTHSVLRMSRVYSYNRIRLDTMVQWLRQGCSNLHPWRNHWKYIQSDSTDQSGGVSWRINRWL